MLKRFALRQRQPTPQIRAGELPDGSTTSPVRQFAGNGLVCSRDFSQRRVFPLRRGCLAFKTAGQTLIISTHNDLSSFFFVISKYPFDSNGLFDPSFIR